MNTVITGDPACTGSRLAPRLRVNGREATLRAYLLPRFHGTGLLK